MIYLLDTLYNVWYNKNRKANRRNVRGVEMWEVRVKVTMSSIEKTSWYDEEAAETVTSEEWSAEQEIARLKVRIDHTGKDEEGEYLPDDEVTADAVIEAVEGWQERTGLADDETTEIHYYYEPEKAKRCR